MAFLFLFFLFFWILDNYVFSFPIMYWWYFVGIWNSKFHQTTEKAIIRKEKHLDEKVEEDEEVIYKIEVPANR